MLSKAYELTNSSIDCYAKSGTSLYIFLHKLTKNWRKNKPPPPSLEFFSFPEEKSFCVSNTLINYLIRRKAWGTNKAQGLVSLIKPHKAVWQVLRY